MARTEHDRSAQPSLLDRLTDETPKEAVDRIVAPDASIRAYRASVQRDIEWLLNTRRTIVPVSPSMHEVRHSVHEFGLRDTTGLAIGTAEAQRTLTAEMTDALRRFEPRLTNVVVKLTNADQVKAPQIRFLIEATLLMDPSAERIAFDTTLEVSSGEYAVKESQ